MSPTPQIPTKPLSLTLPQRVGPLVVDWGNELNAEVERLSLSHRSGTTLVKRPAPTSQDGDKPAKRIKAEEALAEVSDEQVKSLIARNALKKLSVVELKAWLRSKGVTVWNQKKAECMEMVEAWWERKSTVG